MWPMIQFDSNNPTPITPFMKYGAKIMNKIVQLIDGEKNSQKMSLVEAIPAIATNSRARQQHIFSLLQTCSFVKNLTQIHAQILINGFSQKNFLIVRLISLYVTYGHFPYARKMFDEIPSPTTTAWNQMIRGYAHCETPKNSVELYSRMLEKGVKPDGYTYSYLISACARGLMLREGEQIHGRVLSSGYCSNVFVGTSLVNLYCSGASDVGLESAYKVFDEMPERNVETWNTLLDGYTRCERTVGVALKLFDEMPEKTVVSWTIMITGCARNGEFKQSLSLFREMRKARVELDQAALVAALSACAELGDLSLGKWIHSYVNEEFRGGNQEIGVRLQNAFIHMYASCGVIEEAYRVFKNMHIRSTVSWTSVIIGFARHGFAEKALDVFKWMENLGEVRPDAITFIGVLSACSHAGYVEEGQQYFKEMKEKWAIEPRIEHYGCMVDLLSRAGLLNEALRLIEKMPMKPNDVIWGALLGGCMIHRNPEIASYAARSLMMVLDEDQIVDYLVPLSKVHAMAKRWQDFAIVREKVGSRNTTGRSSVQINGTIHDFVAGDTTHEDASLVYDVLNRLTSEVGFLANKHDMKEEDSYLGDDLFS